MFWNKAKAAEDFRSWPMEINLQLVGHGTQLKHTSRTWGLGPRPARIKSPNTNFINVYL